MMGGGSFKCRIETFIKLIIKFKRYLNTCINLLTSVNIFKIFNHFLKIHNFQIGREGGWNFEKMLNNVKESRKREGGKTSA